MALSPTNALIVPAVLRQALESIGVPTAQLRRLDLGTPLSGRSKPTAAVDARRTFLDAASTPEQRLLLAQELNVAYAEVTNWAIRADLMRLATVTEEKSQRKTASESKRATTTVRMIGAPEAAALADAGVVGVRDLAAWTDDDEDDSNGGTPAGAKPDRRWQELLARMRRVPSGAAAALKLQRLTRVRLNDAAADLPPRIISAVPVVLLVKGAGVQQPDETLNQLIGGFWAAVNRLDPAATLRQRHDIFPPGYRSSPHETEPHNHVTEVRSGEHAIWIREVDWEAEVAAPDPLRALLTEWRLSSYALARSITDIFDGDRQMESTWKRFVGRAPARGGLLAMVRRLRRQTRLPLTDIQQRVAEFARALPQRVKDMPRRVQKIAAYSTVAYTAYYNLQHLVILLPALAVAAAHVPAGWPWAASYLRLLLALYALGSVAAIPPAIITSRRWGRFFLARRPFARLPGLPNWMLGLLVTAMLLDPVTYFGFILVLLLMQVTLLIARGIAWPYRESIGTDTSGQFYSAADPEGGLVWRRRHHPLMKFCQYLYRHIVVLTVPAGLFIYFLARLMRFTRVLEIPGVWLEKIISVTLSGGLGDVVGYASDPAHAHRVQSVVAADARFFLERPEVSGLHLFAHSMGTPITFETLFHHLEPRYTRQVKTYVTIGSVLSYFRQVNPVLDPVFVERFPVPIESLPPLADGFRWLNFWNFTDPITEYYGLDEYQLYVQPDDKSRPERHANSPRDIKTRAGVENHAEYWTNREQIHEPFFQRLTGDDEPPRWGADQLRTKPAPPGLRWLARLLEFFKVPFHVFYAYCWWIALLVGLGAAVALLPRMAQWIGLGAWLASLAQSLNAATAAALAEVTARSAFLAGVVIWITGFLAGAGEIIASPALGLLGYTVAYILMLIWLGWALVHTLWTAVGAWAEPAPRVDISEPD